MGCPHTLFGTGGEACRGGEGKQPGVSVWPIISQCSFRWYSIYNKLFNVLEHDTHRRSLFKLSPPPELPSPRLVPPPPPHHSADALGAGAAMETTPPLDRATAPRQRQRQQQQLHRFRRPLQAPGRLGSGRRCWGSPGQPLRRFSTARHAGHPVRDGRCGNDERCVREGKCGRVGDGGVVLAGACPCLTDPGHPVQDLASSPRSPPGATTASRSWLRLRSTAPYPQDTLAPGEAPDQGREGRPGRGPGSSSPRGKNSPQILLMRGAQTTQMTRAGGQRRWQLVTWPLLH